ncbi:MAG: biotin transporter BioY [Anaerolineae bacterium]|nr:biotin transporter BioY [Anaerolineae bacterium]
MLRTLEQTRDHSLAQRLAAIAFFVVLTIIFARVTLEIGPVPLTLQTLAVFLCGMVLGGRDGMIAQLIYVGLIAIGLPFDARGLGSAVFAGPTVGYLIGFIPCALVTGLIVERVPNRFLWYVGAALIGSMFLFGLGATALLIKGIYPTVGEAISSGILLFMPENLAKAVMAAGMTESARRLLLYTLTPKL